MKIRAYTKDNERLNERQSARVFFFTAPPSTHVRSPCVGEPDSRSTSRRFCNFRLLHSGLQGISERMAGEEHEHFRTGELAADAFAMMLIGALLKKKDIIDENGKKCLSDLCINVVIPCNIFKSCLIELDAGVLKSCEMLLVSAVIMQLLCLVLNRLLF